MQTFKAYFNRVVVAVTFVAGLATAVTPAVADLDFTSTAGVIAGFAGITTAASIFLLGWQKHEARVADPYFSDSNELGAKEQL